MDLTFKPITSSQQRHNQLSAFADLLLKIKRGIMEEERDIMKDEKTILKDGRFMMT